MAAGGNEGQTLGIKAKMGGKKNEKDKGTFDLDMNNAQFQHGSQGQIKHSNPMQLQSNFNISVCRNFPFPLCTAAALCPTNAPMLAPSPPNGLSIDKKVCFYLPLLNIDGHLHDLWCAR